MSLLQHACAARIHSASTRNRYAAIPIAQSSATAPSTQVHRTLPDLSLFLVYGAMIDSHNVSHMTEKTKECQDRYQEVRAETVRVSCCSRHTPCHALCVCDYYCRLIQNTNATSKFFNPEDQGSGTLVGNSLHSKSSKTRWETTG